MNYQKPRALTMGAMELLAGRAANAGDLVLRAGAPAKMAAPSGMADILTRGGQGSLGVSGGLTLIKSAAAFTAPSFVTAHAHERANGRVEHYAIVQRTTSGDATHESFYPTVGEHVRPGMVQNIGGRVYRHYWLISQKIADLIRQGEQEHLDDAARAYELTYKKIEDEINALAGQRFGPAGSPGDADSLAEEALARRLPPELGTDPANWVKVLDRLLTQTRTRDTKAWHALRTDPPQTVGLKILHPVVTTGGTRVGQVPSSQVVNY